MKKYGVLRLSANSSEQYDRVDRNQSLPNSAQDGGRTSEPEREKIARADPGKTPFLRRRGNGRAMPEKNYKKPLL